MENRIPSLYNNLIIVQRNYEKLKWNMEEMNKINSIQNYIGTYSFEPESDEFILDHLAQKSASEKRVKFGEITSVGSN